MKGEVEIWDGDTLLFKEDNLLVDGAGELIANIMTVNPSYEIADYTSSAFYDASNYTIQAISFGKDVSAFQYNAHALPANINLNYHSTFSGEGTATNAGFDVNGKSLTEGEDWIISSCPQISNPPGYEDVPSATAHVTLLVDNSTTQNINFRNLINFKDPNSNQLGEFGVSGFQDKWICASVYIKPENDLYPFNLNILDGASTDSPDQAQTKFYLTLQDDSSFPNKIARNRAIIYWDPTSSGNLSPSSVEVVEPEWVGDDRDFVYGFPEDEWEPVGGVQDVGDGWYRIFTSVPGPSAADFLLQELRPAGFDGGTNTGETSGGLYTFGWQVQGGKWPTPVQFTSGFRALTFDLSGTALNQWYGEYGSEGAHPIDKGTIRGLLTEGSSYVPVNTLTESPNPYNTRLEQGITSNNTFSGTFSSMNFGQNLNMIPWRSFGRDGSQLRYPTAFSAYSELDSGTSNYVVNTIWPFDGNAYRNYGETGTEQTGTLGNQAYYLGCYPEGSSTGGSNWVLLESLTDYLGYDDKAPNGTYTTQVSGVYNGIFNEASSMDAFGFVNKVMSATPSPTYSMSSTSSGLCVSAGDLLSDNSDLGVVEYSLLLGAGDLGYANLYGGIYNMGLWSLDLKRSIQAGNNPPYAFTPLNNLRKYKLFATKHFTKSLTFIEDDGLDAGSLNYTDLTLKWRIRFL